MTRTLIAIAVAGAVFAGVSGTSQAAPMASESCMCSHPKGSAAQAGGHHGWRGHNELGSLLGGRGKGSRRGGLFAKIGGMRSLMAMMGNGQGGGGLESMLGGMGGAGGIQQMLGGMGGAGGMQAMMGGMGGGGGGGQDSQAARQACTPDAMRLCSDAIPDVAKVKACMRAKSAQLSEPCRAAMNGAGGTQQPAVASREADNVGGGRNYGHFEGGQSYGHSEGGQGYDRFGGVQSLDSFSGGQGFGGQNFGGQGGMDVGRLIGMARGMGFGSRDDWRD